MSKTPFSVLVLFLVLFSSYLFAQGTNATLSGQFNTNGQAMDVTVVNNIAYVSDFNWGLRILNVSNPSSIQDLGSYLPPAQSMALSAAVDGNYAYVATDKEGLRIVNISAPHEGMTETGGITFNGSLTSDYCDGVAVSNGYAYVTNNVHGLQIVNVSTPTRPSLVKTVSTGEYANGVAVNGSYAYVTTNLQGLKVIDISNPSNASVVSSYPLADKSFGIALNGNYAYIANELHGIQVIDISDPLHPKLAGTFDTNGQARDVAVSGNFAYAADYNNGLVVIDINKPLNPANPVSYPANPESSYLTNDQALGVAVSGTKAYVAANLDGLYIINNDILNSGTVKLTFPNGNEILKAGSTQNISWTAAGGVSYVKIEYSTNNGSSWSTVSASTRASSGSYQWTVPNTPSADCRVRVSSTANALVNDISDQKFSIYSLSLISPNGGEKLRAGSVQAIKWSAGGLSNVKLEYSTDNGTAWSLIIASTPSGAGSYQWTVPDAASDQCLVRISDAMDPSVNAGSAAVFTIYKFWLTSPNGGENWIAGTLHNITWNVTTVANVKLEYTKDNGTSWTLISASEAASSGSYSWTVPSIASEKCKVRISDVSNASVNDFSDNIFTISAPPQSVQVLYPNGSEALIAGSTQNITWTSQNIQNVKLEYSADNGAAWQVISASLAASAASYAWTVPAATSSQCKIRISDASDGNPMDASDAVFSIVSQAQQNVSLLMPSGGESWVIGSQQQIKWTSSNISTVKIQYSTDSGVSWNVISPGTAASSGTVNWTVPNAPSSQCMVRVSDASDGQPYAENSTPFSIVQGTQSITVTAPNGGESWPIGGLQHITWSAMNVSSVIIEFSTDGGASWSTIANNVSGSSGLYTWMVPNTPSSNCRIRISDAVDKTPTDQSNASFTIPGSNKSITVTSPVSGDRWEIGTVHNVTWTASNMDFVVIQYTTNNGMTWEDVGSSAGSAGTFSWTIPNVNADHCTIRIYDPSVFSIQGLSGDFAMFSDARNMEVLSIVNTPGIAKGVTIAGGYAYIADRQSGLMIVDVSDPLHSVEVGSYDTPGNAQAVLVRNGYAFVADSTEGVQIIDVSNPSDPKYVTTYHTLGQACDLKTDKYRDTVMYIADGTKGLVIVNISNPRLPKTIGALVTPGISCALTPGVESVMIAAHDGGLRMIDTRFVSDPAHPENPAYPVPVELGSWTNGLNAHGIAHVYDQQGNHGYAIMADHSGNGHITVVNTDHPQSPEFAAMVDLQEKPYGIWADPMRDVYVADGTRGLKVLDAYYPDRLLEIGHLDTQGSALNVTSSYNYVYIADGAGGLVVAKNKNYTADEVGLSSPRGGEIMRAGKTFAVWVGKYMLDKVRIEFSSDNGATWSVIADDFSGNTFYWKIPSIASEQCKMRVSNELNRNVKEEMQHPFTIVIPSLAVTSPDHSETFYMGDTTNITWVSQNVNKVTIEYTDGVRGWTTLASDLDASLGSFQWIIPTENIFPSTTCTIRIKDSYYTDLMDESKQFSMRPPHEQLLMVTRPNQPEIFAEGTTEKITWSSGYVKNVNLEYSTDNGTSWLKIAENVPAGQGSYEWKVPGTYSINALMRISDAEDGSPADLSDKTFIICEPYPTITLASPAKGDKWEVSTSQAIKWTASKNIANVKIEFTSDNGSSWPVIAASVPASDGAYYWHTPDNASGNCRIRVSNALNAGTYGINDSLFAVTGTVAFNTTHLGALEKDGQVYFDVTVKNGYAYAAAVSGLRIINISNPGAPFMAGAFDFAANKTGGQARGVTVSGKYAYVAAYDAGLRIIDISNPAGPVEAGYFDTPGHAMRAAVSGSYAYVADLDGGFRIINISDPAHPFEAGYFAAGGYVISLAVSGNYAYLANYSNGLTIVDINNPTAPQLAGRLEGIGEVRDIELLGGAAYAANYDAGLQVINISDPAAPYVMNSIKLGGMTLGLNLRYPFAYMADGELGLQAVDITDINSLSRAAHYNTGRTAEDVWFDGNMGFIADYDGGLHIVRNDLEAALPVELTEFTAKAAGSTVVLHWSTATEVNNSGFYIERLRTESTSHNSSAQNSGYQNSGSQAAGSQTSGYQSSGPQLSGSVFSASDWRQVGFVSGAGTSNSRRTYTFADRNLPSGKYQYRLKQVDNDGSFKYTSLAEASVMNPGKFGLEQNYPNPFNPATRIRYSIPEISAAGSVAAGSVGTGSGAAGSVGTVSVTLKIYDALGREVKQLVNEEQAPGYYEVEWDAHSFASGIYYSVMEAHSGDGQFNYRKVNKMIVLK